MTTAIAASTTTIVALPGWLNADTILQGLGPYVFLGVALLRGARRIRSGRTSSDS